MYANTECNICGRIYKADLSKALDLDFCPNCLRGRDRYFISVEDTVHLPECLSGKINAVSSLTCLLLQTIVVPGEKIPEGRLIEVVTVPWHEIVNFLQKDPSSAHEIPPYKWEEIVAGAYVQAGFEVVIHTPRSGDHGKDIIAEKRGIGCIRIIDQVKAYRPGHLVPANDVRALIGVLQTDGASKGFLTTTSDFAPRIKKDPTITPLIPSKLELINGESLIKRLKELSEKK